MTETPPGWYPDQKIPGQARYWDGTQWTEHTAPGAGSGQPPGGPAPVGAAHPGGPPQQNWFLRHKVWSVIIALFVIGVIASAAGGSGSDDGDSDDSSATDTSDDSTKDTDPTKKADKPEKSPEPEESSEPEPEPEPEDKPEPEVIKVTAAKILKEFEQNEASADLKYGDHQLLEVTGFVSKVDTELIHDDRYIIRVAGPDYEYAFATINCDGQSAEDVAKLKVGQKITVGGDFQDGGDLGIELGGCHVV